MGSSSSILGFHSMTFQSGAGWNLFVDCLCFSSRLINQRLMEEQSQVEELHKNLQEQGSKADDVSSDTIVPHCGGVTDKRTFWQCTTKQSKTKMSDQTAVHKSSKRIGALIFSFKKQY